MYVFDESPDMVRFPVAGATVILEDEEITKFPTVSKFNVANEGLGTPRMNIPEPPFPPAAVEKYAAPPPPAPLFANALPPAELLPPVPAFGVPGNPGEDPPIFALQPPPPP